MPLELGGRVSAGIAEVGDAEIEIDHSKARPDAAAHRDFGGGLGRQLDAGDRHAGIEQCIGRLNGRADRGPATPDSVTPR